MKRLAILGSTGSIGRSALSVVDAHPGRLSVVALAAGENVSLLAEQIATYHPLAVGVATPSVLEELRPEAERERDHAHAVQARDQEMPELVDEHEHAEDQEKRPDGVHDAEYR